MTSMELGWVQHRTVARRCPLCRREGHHPAVIRYRAPYGDHPVRELLRCHGCRSLFLDDLSPAPHIEDSPEVRHHTNFYVELSAGVDVMVEVLYKLDTAAVERYLEIGCGFGFGLDFVRRVFGWQVTGIDPGIIAQTGKQLLGLEIADDYVVPGYDFGGRRFDVMMCSEVLEHVPAPGPFLETLRAGLTEHGVLVLTTPNADRVRPDTPAAVLLPILQPGFHLVLFTRESLDHALREAGFAHAHVWEQGASLCAAAANRPITLRLDAHTDHEHYRTYLEDSVKDGAPSPLTVGMTFRLLKLVTNAGDLAAAEQAFAHTRAAIRSVYGLDIDRPEALGLAALPPLRFRDVGAHMPFCLGCVLYYRGIGMLIAGRHPEAAAFFRAGADAALAIRCALRELEFDDGDTESAWQLSRVHLPMALAHVDARQALQALADLAKPAPASVPADVWSLPPALLVRSRLETFSRLVSRGCYDAAETIMPAVREDLGVGAPAAGDATAATARSATMLSALYCLAILTLNHLVDPREAASLFAATRDACRMRLAEAPDDRQATDLLAHARINEAACRAVAGPDAAHEREAPAFSPKTGVARTEGLHEPPAGTGNAAPPAGPKLLLAGTVEFQVTAAVPDFSGFVLRFGTLGTINSCGVDVEVVSGARRRLAKGAVPTEALFDNGRVLFRFRSRHRLPPGKYGVRVRSPGATSGNCLAVYPDLTDIHCGPVHDLAGGPMLLGEGEIAARPLGDGLSPSRLQVTVLRHWVDAWGVFVDGHLSWAGGRPDALAIGAVHGPFKSLPLAPVDEHTLRFQGYAEAPAGVPLIARVNRGDDDEVLPIVLPAPSPLPQGQDPGLFARFITEMNEGGGLVLEIGSSLGHATSLSQRRFFTPAVRYLGVDIRPDPNTDVVADAHGLVPAIEPGSVRGVFSLSVLEHLAAPWIVAVQINRVLAPGGLVYHQTHQTWPLHATPNDFWRFTDEALKHLFGPTFGFEVLAATMSQPILCHPTHRSPEYLNMPFLPGYGGAYILARKVRDVLTVPTGEEMVELSRRYPQPGQETAPA